MQNIKSTLTKIYILSYLLYVVCAFSSVITVFTFLTNAIKLSHTISTVKEETKKVNIREKNNANKFVMLQAKTKITI